MESALTIFRILVWLISFGGLCGIFVHALKIPFSASPLAALSTVSVIMTFSGMLGWIYPAAVALYGLGFLSAVYEIFRFIRLKPHPSINEIFPILIVLAWIAYCCLRLKAFLPYENDDLSHWALVAREILRTNAFPNAETSILTFSAYPLSAAANIYYFCRFVGESEWIMAFSQALFRLFGFLPLVDLIRKNRAFGYLSFILGFLFIARSNGYIVSLRVDSLLIAYSVGAIGLIFSMEKKPAHALTALLPICIMLTLTKNSGIFFALATSVFFAFRAQKKLGRRRTAAALTASFASSLLSFALWLLYVSFTFPAGLESKHAVNPASYLANAQKIGSSGILSIARAFAGELLHPLPSDILIYFLFLIAIAFMVFLIIKTKKQALARSFSKMLVYLACVYAAWLLFLFVMYVVSMPEAEALEVASFSRYYRTITLYMGGAALAYVYKVTCHEQIAVTRFRQICIRLCTVLLLCLTALSLVLDSRPGMIISTRQDRCERRYHLSSLQETGSVQDAKRYLIFCSPDESSLENNTTSLYYLYKYHFSSTEIGMIYESDAQDGTYVYHTFDNKRPPCKPDELLSAIAGEYDYLLFHTEDEAFSDLLSDIDLGSMKCVHIG